MKQVRIHGVDDTRVDDIPTPSPGPHDALVRMAFCGICGTDLGFIKMGGVTMDGSPMCLGHEMAGVVEWVGPEVGGARVGDRVVVHPGNDKLGRIGNGAAQGGLTELLHVEEATGRLIRVPDAMPLNIAAFAEPLGVGMNAAHKVHAEPGDSVAVFGCGPVGLAAIATLLEQGVRKVVAIDRSAARLDLALALGAQAGLNPTKIDVWEELARLHGTRPFTFGPTTATNAFIEATGSDVVLNDILENGPVDGRMSVVAVHMQPVPTSFLAVMMKQFTIRGAMEYPARFEDTFDLLDRRDLSSLITHRFPLERFNDALAVLDNSFDCGKVMISIDESL